MAENVSAVPKYTDSEFQRFIDLSAQTLGKGGIAPSESGVLSDADKEEIRRGLVALMPEATEAQITTFLNSNFAKSLFGISGNVDRQRLAKVAMQSSEDTIDLDKKKSTMNVFDADAIAGRNAKIRAALAETHPELSANELDMLSTGNLSQVLAYIGSVALKVIQEGIAIKMAEMNANSILTKAVQTSQQKLLDVVSMFAPSDTSETSLDTTSAYKADATKAEAAIKNLNDALIAAGLPGNFSATSTKDTLTKLQGDLQIQVQRYSDVSNADTTYVSQLSSTMTVWTKLIAAVTSSYKDLGNTLVRYIG